VESFLNTAFESKENQDNYRIAGMFVLREIYDELAVFKKSSECYKNSRDAYNNIELSSDMLIFIGFKETGVSNDPRFNRVFTLDGVVSFEIHSDGTWCHIIQADGQRIDIYNIHSLNKYLLTKGIDIIENMKDKFENVSEYFFHFEKLKNYALIFQNVSMFVPDGSTLEDSLSKIHRDGHIDIKEYLTLLKSDDRETHFHTNHIGKKGLMNLYCDSICDDSIKKNIVDYHDFYWSFLSLNKGFIPSFHGSQDGDFIVSEKLGSLIVEISKRYNSDVDEDDD
jgi:hypothetical protein